MPPTTLRRSPILLGWSSLLIASVSCTTADSDGNTETHSLKEQFVPPHTQHDAPYEVEYLEKLHLPPRKVTNDEKQTEHDETKAVTKVKHKLQKIKKRILEGNDDRFKDGTLENRGPLIPVLRNAPLIVQVLGLLQLCISLAALGVSFVQGSRILFPSVGGGSDGMYLEIDPHAARHPDPPERG